MDGKIVRVSLGGNYHFYDPMLGQGGSFSSYSSNADFVELQHLRNHDSVKHSLEDCKIDLCMVKWYEDYFRESYLELCRYTDLNDNATHHFSVINKMLFPIKDLDIVVLHIYLEITLRLFNLVEAEIFKMDGVCKSEEEID